MVGLNNNRGLIKLGLSICTLLITGNNSALAKQEKKGGKEKKVAIVAPVKQKKSDDSDDAIIAANKKLQSKLEAENALNRALLEKKLSAVIAKIEELRIKKECQRLGKEIEDENLRKKHDHEMLVLNMEKERLTMELELEKARFTKQMMEHDVALAMLDKKIQLEKGQVQLLQEQSHRKKAEIEALQAESERGKYITKKPIYLKDPLDKRSNTLILSDRCIDLNGHITPWKANYIVDQIHYFNNKNGDYPIFIVIGDSPGGSIMAGWNILQAIEHSKAPVYVVVKTYAGSMAALITTLATKSYAYPNALILHHQPLSCVWGNLRETKEHYEFLNTIWKRSGGRVAKKMGISLVAFEKKLYEKSMYGDWREYANNAQKLKWVDYVINSIQHSAVSSLPDPNSYTCEKYIKEQYGYNTTKETEQSEAAQYYQLAPYDFDYSYNFNRKNQMIGNVAKQASH
ncbi:MAG: ATP-dependent Clp protease proteolytic subunit [Candidatus Cardinium sp.]|uniref:ATP-dependent Clp protease proteolytic subunit n=1 Tax=Cardinium endosymbiont of Dermatophagoides farinae TaxID=2597823 RepID=UPI0011840646|nr:ATP-dependent Clp protease proteolytic subunit [Cardinium endosymbiont of Dermatophagoides farinae]TSJ80767.1 hypothetical protein FPG78_01720 [Cardinium endosymbiont of Dermatophagoides farinae]UWW96771.1 MAG: ATP-dependent Clp protease proteolytic subunit [Candidatus Cardinium sp.]